TVNGASSSMRNDHGGSKRARSRKAPRARGPSSRASSTSTPVRVAVGRSCPSGRERDVALPELIPTELGDQEIGDLAAGDLQGQAALGTAEAVAHVRHVLVGEGTGAHDRPVQS